MKPFFIIAFLMALLMDRLPAGEVLYLHLFTPTCGQKVDPSPGEDPATPPARVITLAITPDSDFEAIFGRENSSVSGRVNRSGDSVDIKLKGMRASGFKFDGTVALEEIFEPDVTFFSGAVFRYKCVVSRNKEIEPFLKIQADRDAKRLEEATLKTRENKRRIREAEKNAEK